ncbi:MAG: class I SAM-dependent methyltransferase [Firmicutes bacterium]|nr:class I SAM-dependent methyltransferase [Bacillota bacterium]
MLDRKGFNLWADEYDKAVGLSDEENSYPFAGYKEVLGGIFRIIMEKEHAAVLDLGFGTGTLTTKLYEHGCDIYGQDFSERMVELASGKMPGAHLYLGDLTEGLAKPLRNQTYDYIVATYVLHHLTDEQKIVLIRDLLGLLKKDGKILIGDISFETIEKLDRCRQEAGDEWDDEEIYIVAEEMKKAFPNLTFTQVSFCAGILTLA